MNWLDAGNTPDPPPPVEIPEPGSAEPMKLPRAEPVDRFDAVPKAYLDAQINPLLERIAALEARIRL